MELTYHFTSSTTTFDMRPRRILHTPYSVCTIDRIDAKFTSRAISEREIKREIAIAKMGDWE